MLIYSSYYNSRLTLVKYAKSVKIAFVVAPSIKLYCLTITTHPSSNSVPRCSIDWLLSDCCLWLAGVQLCPRNLVASRDMNSPSLLFWQCGDINGGYQLGGDEIINVIIC